jgi:SAM-dependent methyltransferase
MAVEDARGEFLAELIGKYVRPEASILEVGCKGGRNLDPLYRAGMTELTGVEEDPERMGQVEQRFPEVWRRIRVIEGPLVDSMRRFTDGEFDLVFSVGYFEGHADYEGLFDEMARVAASYLVVIEDERPVSDGAPSRDFGKIFTSRGFEQVEEIDVSSLPGLESVFNCRVFRKG